MYGVSTIIQEIKVVGIKEKASKGEEKIYKSIVHELSRVNYY